MVDDLLFSLIKVLVSVSIVIIMGYFIPWAKTSINNSEYKWVLEIVTVAVQAAEQTLTQGTEKKAVVTKFVKEALEKNNIHMTDEQISDLIESAVYAMNQAKIK